MPRDEPRDRLMVDLDELLRERGLMSAASFLERSRGTMTKGELPLELLRGVTLAWGRVTVLRPGESSWSCGRLL